MFIHLTFTYFINDNISLEINFIQPGKEKNLAKNKNKNDRNNNLVTDFYSRNTSNYALKNEN